MYLHCTADENIQNIKDHGREAGRIELVGRNDLDLTGNSTDWADYDDLEWDWMGWNKGAVYCLKDTCGAATAYGRTCFVLIPELTEFNTAIEIENPSQYNDEGEILVPLDDFEIAEVIVDGESFSPEEWLENTDELY
jgi:hypothetical protein